MKGPHGPRVDIGDQILAVMRSRLASIQCNDSSHFGIEPLNNLNVPGQFG